MIKINLRELLAERGWKQVDLAKATGLRANTISNMCRGATENVNLRHIGLICEALDCNVAEIYEDIPKKGTKRASRFNNAVDDPDFARAIRVIVDKELKWRMCGGRENYELV